MKLLQTSKLGHHMWTWWNDLDWVSYLSSLSNWLVAIFGICALVLGSREGALEGRKDEQRDRLISENNRQTEEAKRDAAKSNEIAATTNERAARLEKEAADAKLELEKLKQRTSPRGITPEQENLMLSILSAAPKGRVTIWAVNGDAEAFEYMQTISRFLTKVGNAVSTNTAVIFSQQASVGMQLTVKSKETAPQHAIAIQVAFEKAGIPADSFVADGMEDDLLDIFVGSKPNK